MEHTSDEIPPHVLIVEARYYEDLANDLLEGAKKALNEAGATYDVITVPGALEIPAAITYGESGETLFDGYIALGTVIRGETYHFDIVANESSRALMELSVKSQLAIGNGILTVENMDQAVARAKSDQMDKGGFAARATMRMIELRNQFGLGYE